LKPLFLFQNCSDSSCISGTWGLYQALKDCAA
jgi:hypothetical protein